ncbi:Uncharacterised protein [Mycobacterium tuberculosis]|nr:Uncharacterised protein [Mycobacterium tuberculosis]
MMVKCFSADDERPARSVQPLTDCPAAGTFGAFADEIGPDGFQLLYQRTTAGHEDGPALVTVADDRIVGAVGPLATVAWPYGRVIQQPAYFTVHPAYGGRAHSPPTLTGCVDLRRVVVMTGRITTTRRRSTTR